MSNVGYNKIYFASWFLCVATLPWLIQWNSAAILALCIVSLAEGNYAEKWRRLKAAPWVLPFLFFFLLHAIGFVYSDDKAAASFELEKKLSFIALPLIAASGPLPDQLTLKRLCR